MSGACVNISRKDVSSILLYDPCGNTVQKRRRYRPIGVAMHSEIFHRQPVHPSIDEGMIKILVHAFYAKVRTDPEIGPIFAHVIADGWDDHLAKMCDFWSSVMLRTGGFKGNPMVAHMRLKAIRPQHFDRWLTLFRLTAEEVCPYEIAILFIGRAENIARSLQLGMFYRPDLEAGGDPVQGASSRSGLNKAGVQSIGET